MLHISIDTIPQKQHEYATYGNYKGHIRRRFIEVSELNDWRWEFLIALHELIEQNIALALGLSEAEILAWDLAHLESDDPGSLDGCPYKFMHLYAERAEKDMCRMCNWDYEEYCKALDKHSDKEWPKDDFIKTGNLA